MSHFPGWIPRGVGHFVRLEEFIQARDDGPNDDRQLISTAAVNSPITLCLEVNGRRETVDVPAKTKLLHVLRNDLKLNGPKFGCGLGECGACAVLIDGDCVRSCVVPVGNVVGLKIVTLEGLGSADCPHPIQAAFIAAQAAQCGYCLNGMILAAKALLDRNVRPTDEEIKRALQYHLCRCGTHLEIIEAVRRASDAMISSTYGS